MESLNPKEKQRPPLREVLRERHGFEPQLTHLWMIAMVFMFLLYGFYTWRSHGEPQIKKIGDALVGSSSAHAGSDSAWLPREG
ncbi:MAG: hypothetical protein A49_13320 [Methyloceanibacter sp.]|nr:MAG: hypothetical protein A49_13320 [Methyloceanibacter sp.]